ncbi:Beta-catenin-like protein 1 [Schistosoma japonicum]|nr:Beta-catenin-like protein 1 [Schistosoma japonicum]
MHKLLESTHRCRIFYVKMRQKKMKLMVYIKHSVKFGLFSTSVIDINIFPSNRLFMHVVDVTDKLQPGLLLIANKSMEPSTIFDKNKLYVSELLSMLLKMDETNRRQLDEVDGIDILLHQLSVYKRRDPGNQEEIELMRNLFNCLCSSLMLPENKDRFLKGEGIQLMNLMLRQFMISLNDDRAILRIVIYKLVMYRFVYLSMWIALCIRVIEQYPGE